MKRPVVMILLAGALTLSMIAPSALPAVAGNVSVVHAAVKTSNDAAVKTSMQVNGKIRQKQFMSMQMQTVQLRRLRSKTGCAGMVTVRSSIFPI